MSRTPIAEEGTEAHVRRLIEHQFQASDIELERMTYGHGSVTFRATLPSRTLIVRTNKEPAAFEGTSRNLEILRQLGVPVPEVLFVDLSTTKVPFAVIVTDTFQGRDLGFVLGSMDRQQQSSVAEKIVGFERLVSRLPIGDGYGYVPIGATTHHEEWSAVVFENRNPIPSASDPEVAALIELVVTSTRQAVEFLDATPATPFLDDLTTKNVIVHNGLLQGVIDFDVICYGDPMFWLSLTHVGVISDVGEPGYFYLRELARLWAPSDGETRKLGLYTALHAAEFLSWGDEGTHRRQRLINAAEIGLAVFNQQKMLTELTRGDLHL